MKFEIVLAHTSDRGIGVGNDLAWSCKEDMAFFKKLTLGNNYNAVIMGSNTWKSLEGNCLKGRLNVVISSSIRKEDLPPGVILHRSIPACIQDLLTMGLDTVYIIGGGSIYSQFFNLPIVSKIYANEIIGISQKCDVFVDEIPDGFKIISEYLGKSESVIFREYKRICTTEEDNYINMVKDVINNGDTRGDRTGTGTLSLFGKTMCFSLRDGKIPVLTTKKVFWKGVVKELLWMISGSTNTRMLSEQGVKIWDQNSSRDFLDNLGFYDRKEGDLGPVYGHQWRYFGAEYKDCQTSYAGQGVDQLADCIDKIKNDPYSRRIIMSAWNPVDIEEMNLPPCHMMVQFYVSDGELSCQMYQRSCDLGLGVPFNIASYSLLTHMIAQVCGLKAKEFIHVMGDAHVYKNHVNPLQIQMERYPLGFPTVKLNENIRHIDDFSFEDVELCNYFHHPSISMPFSA